MAGNFHSEALHLVERYTMRDANTIDYEVTIDDAKVFTRTWTIKMPLHRQTDADRIFEYQCQAEAEEASGAFEPIRRRDAGPSVTVQTPAEWKDVTAWKAPERKGEIKRMPDGKPDLQGYFMPDGGGGNYGLGKHEQDFLTPGGRGVIVDPPDGNLPMQAWAKAEAEDRKTPERGYDDPTAHCFVAGVPIDACRLPCRFSSRRATSSSCTSECHGERSQWMGALTCQTIYDCGKAIRSAAGKAIRSSSRPRT